MTKLNEAQKEFILNFFFPTVEYAGWKNIGEKLLDTGKCIVAGETCIWQGGIGNFISVKPAEDTVGCSLYTFDIDSFLESQLYIHTKDNYVWELLSRLEQEKLELEEKIKRLREI